MDFRYYAKESDIHAEARQFSWFIYINKKIIGTVDNSTPNESLKQSKKHRTVRRCSYIPSIISLPSPLGAFQYVLKVSRFWTFNTQHIKSFVHAFIQATIQTITHNLPKIIVT